MKKNENYTDRLIRLFIAIIFFILGRFWLWWIIQYIFLAISLIAFLTSVIWICPLYYLFKIDTKKNKNLSKKINIALLVLLVILLWWLTHLSMFFTAKFFIEDYNKVDNVYKQLLFNTWKEKREESIKYYDELIPILKNFENKYLNYKPYKLNSDLQEIDKIVKDLKDWVYTWNLAKTHIKLEKVRTIFQDILKRNWFSLAWIALVDFHDVMEILIEASDAKDKNKLIENYALASEKLKIVEWYWEIKWLENIKNNLDKLLDLSKNDKLDELSKQAQELKSSFIKVYLASN